ncbi:MAG: hypothetical protein KKG95_01365 [Candidatus Omnitrophica bacterium]|nr:hypothetical protein [Candidatus Omnitrophota bacterium]
MTKGIIKEQKAFSGPVIQKTPPALGGIMYSPSKPQAILNGRIVEKGDAVGEFTVDNILPDVVKISSGEDKFDLRMR